MPEIPLKITDTTFRDAHQSLLATRLRTSDMEPLAPGMDAVGFHSMEVWGGAGYMTEAPMERFVRDMTSFMHAGEMMSSLRARAMRRI